MWGAISRIFHKTNGKVESSNEEIIMDRGEGKRHLEPEAESHATRQAKQRATVKWLLSKAYNNRVPENLREPFYRNHEDQEHLKPAVVHYLANAELYCMALSNIYSDPNYNNLNHWGVLQALARKGVYISDPHITETVLIQTTPIKLSAHVTVMQGVMSLYAREVASPELIGSAVKRFSPAEPPPAPPDHEAALQYWVSHAVSALTQRIANQDKERGEFPPVKEVTDLCDGAWLAGLIAFYCPEKVDPSSIRLSPHPTVSDCVRNLSLVADFCASQLPSNIFHMTPEELYYMRGSLKQNLVVFLADLFNMLEIHPAQCVTLNSATSNTANAEGRNSQGVAHKRSLPQAVSAIPDLRSGLDSRSSFSGSPVLTSSGLKKPSQNNQTELSSENRITGNGNCDDEFVVHRGRGVPTLSSVIGSDNSKASEPAGKPTNWEPRKPSFAGRRSRRNSLSDESQLTLENFGGSEENLHLLGRNPDKEPAVHSGRRESSARSSVLDNNSDALHHALQEGYNSKQAPEPPPRVSLSRNNSFIESQRRAEESRSSAGIQQMLLDPPDSPDPKSQEKEKKVTTFATLPQNTTTWQQQSIAHQNVDQLDNGLSDTTDNGVMGSQLLNIRLKLEEKRRRIESEKRRMEAQLNRQRQKVGKAAFLQAVSKGKVAKSPESDPGREASEVADKPARPFSLQDISEVEQKWLAGDGFTEERKTPDMDNMDIETYQKSIAQMNSSLHEIQADLQRLANQQNQLQSEGKVQTRPTSQSPQIQPQPTPPPQMQSFASLHHQQGNYTSQHINFSSQHTTPTHHYQQPQQQTPPYPPQQPHNYPPPQAPHYGNQLNNFNFGNQQQPNNQHEYYNGRPYNQHQQQQQQMQQMHSLMTSANNTQNNYNNTQQWHSLSQQPPQPNYNTYSPRYNQGFTLHGNYEDNYSTSPSRRESQGEFYLHEPQSGSGRRTWGQPFTPDPTTWNSSPKQNGGDVPTPPPRLNHAPLPTPPVDDMEPQSISFIGSAEDGEQLSSGLSKLNITSGNRTYRIPSPTRSVRNSLQRPTPNNEKQEQGFYISFDEEAPKRPKPPLRAKRGSPKKERNLTQTVEPKVLNASSEPVGPVEEAPPPARPRVIHSPPGREERVPPPHDAPIVIGSHPDPVELDEMEKKKERILMMSLQRRQAAEEARNQKELEAARRRDAEKAKEEEKLRKKEEDKRRRAAILERYKIKKAIEEADREGKQVDKELLNSLKASLPAVNSSSSGGPKMRSKGSGPGRPRPKTIHIDSGAEETGTITPSRGKKGSSSNLSALNSTMNSTMRRDYYRGSQDCLAETRKPTSRLYVEVGDESRGTSPGRSLGRRSSYKTSRDGSPEIRTMGRPRVGTATRRKSNSLMNLAGSSCDQDSLAYRYTDTDSGLGRATPPRRVPSPSGPGSLPAGRRRPDDSLSDAGSDYNGPRLYRQPATKSNKSIVLNAVEYCVFPGAVNREAKQRVIEEMNRSEAKHFLVLFRDSGCQFRALYAYWPDTEEVIKLYGTGPKQVNDRMFDKFFKYNSGGKCFSQVHTKHLTVTIDAFTIHNSLWQGKKVNLPNKRDMTLVV